LSALKNLHLRLPCQRFLWKQGKAVFASTQAAVVLERTAGWFLTLLGLLLRWVRQRKTGRSPPRDLSFRPADHTDTGWMTPEAVEYPDSATRSLSAHVFEGRFRIPKRSPDLRRIPIGNVARGS